MPWGQAPWGPSATEIKCRGVQEPWGSSAGGFKGHGGKGLQGRLLCSQLSQGSRMEIAYCSKQPKPKHIMKMTSD